MAKKSKIFSQLALAALAIGVLGLAGNISRAHACAGDSSDDPETATDCVEASAEGDSSLLVESNASSDDVIELDVEKYDAYFTADDEVSSSRALPHSIFLAGNSVSSADSVEGVSFLAGNVVTLDGAAEYVAAAGSSVKINGRVENDLFVAGNTIELGEDASIGRDVFSAGNIFTVRSNLNGNVFFAGNRLVLENVTINGNLNADASEIVIKGKSAISGNFSHSASAKITGLDELSVEGETSTFASASTAPVFSMSKVTNFLFSLLGQILVTLAALFFLPEFGKKLLDSFRLKTSWKYLALGLVLIVCLPLALIFLAFTFVGLP
ncbi:hypothetical protein IJH89_00440, partial [Candidatus Saccharibacteria bacterium]|nr:hypothetical protein [Candidatus Saccharibacteria bacterium]